MNDNIKILILYSMRHGRQYAANKKGRFFSLDKNSSKFRKWHRCNLKRNTSVLVAARESSTNSAFNSVKILGVGALLLNIFDDGRINNEKNLRNYVFADAPDAPKKCMEETFWRTQSTKQCLVLSILSFPRVCLSHALESEVAL